MENNTQNLTARCVASCAGVDVRQRPPACPRTSPAHQELDAASREAEKPVGQMPGCPLWASTVLQAEVDELMSVTNLATLKIAGECLPKPQTHPWLKGRGSQLQQKWATTSTGSPPHHAMLKPAWRRNAAAKCKQRQESCQQQADKKPQTCWVQWWTHLYIALSLRGSVPVSQRAQLPHHLCLVHVCYSQRLEGWKTIVWKTVMSKSVS